MELRASQTFQLQAKHTLFLPLEVKVDLFFFPPILESRDHTYLDNLYS